MRGFFCYNWVMMMMMMIVIYVRRVVSGTYCFVIFLRVWGYAKLRDYI